MCFEVFEVRPCRGPIILLITTEDPRTPRPGSSSVRILVRSFPPQDGKHNERCSSLPLALSLLRWSFTCVLPRQPRRRATTKGMFIPPVLSNLIVLAVRLNMQLLNPKRNSTLSESDRGGFSLRICKVHFQSEICARLVVCSLRWLLCCIVWITFVSLLCLARCVWLALRSA